MKLKSGLLAAIGLLAAQSCALAGSTIDPTQPPQGGQMLSAPVRNNFLAAFNDITNILGQFPGSIAPPNPIIGQRWRNTSVTPNTVFEWSGTAWLQVGTFDAIGGAVTPYFGNQLLAWQQMVPGLGTNGQCLVFTGTSTNPTAQNCLNGTNFTATLPITANTTGANTTLGLNFDTNFAAVGGNLAFNSIAAGDLIANCTGSAAEPTLCSWNSFANQAIGSTNGMFPLRFSGAWQAGSFDATHSISGGVVSLNLGNPNTWTGQQTFVAPILGAATGTSLALGGCTIGSNVFCVTGTLSLPNNSLTLAEFPTIGANTVLGSIAGGTPIALSQAQITSLINPATASIPGLAPAFPNNTTTYARGDGTYATLNFAALGGSLSPTQCPTFTSSTVGCAQASGGGTVNFLRADGTWAAAGAGAGVSSFNTRSGAVVPGSSDYTAPQIAYTPPGTGGVATTVSTELTKTLVWIKDYGAVCDGVTNDTTAIQNAWNYAASIGSNVWLGNVGPSCVITQLTMPTPVAVSNAGGLGQGQASMLVGPGSNQLTLLTNVTGTNCAITLSATYGTNSSLGGTFGGFGLRQSTNSQVGQGFCLNGITKLAFSDIRVNQFNIGFNGNDTITITIDKSNFSANNYPIQAQKVSFSPPNVWIVTNTSFDSNLKYVISLYGGIGNILRDDVFETNGGTLGAANRTIYLTQSASSPIILASIINCYFENNVGAEIVVDQLSTTSVNALDVLNNQFSRSQSNLQFGVYVLTTGGSGVYTVVNVGGNGFQDAIGGTFAWLGAGSTVNYLYRCTSVPNVSNGNINSTCVTSTTGYN